jgi:hypothetical protein
VRDLIGEEKEFRFLDVAFFSERGECNSCLTGPIILPAQKDQTREKEKKGQGQKTMPDA